ncbi:hypothetical protein HYFRA_00009310 [Hymenoscyphus fraxineus]|uniref:Uncharacterized protein n=1 Tax=Hymenoscyphus fraxineus TaxID=746836 RepID=A0A9N9PKH2_9HELO|nr:hypothetical protein HYFRA_00009310 [Hymenoscyphus fraxineus]
MAESGENSRGLAMHDAVHKDALDVSEVASALHVRVGFAVPDPESPVLFVPLYSLVGDWFAATHDTAIHIHQSLALVS